MTFIRFGNFPLVNLIGLNPAQVEKGTVGRLICHTKTP